MKIRALSPIAFFVTATITILLIWPTSYLGYGLITDTWKISTCNNGICFIVFVVLVIVELVLLVAFLLSIFLTGLFLKKSLAKEQDNEINISKSEPQLNVSSSQPTELLEAILTKEADSVRTALENHPEQLNTAYAQNGNTPLHVAALNGYTEMVRLLLAQPGIDKAIKNKDGKTALALAQEKGLDEIAALLQ